MFTLLCTTDTQRKIDDDVTEFYDLSFDSNKQVARQKKSNPFGFTIKKSSKKRPRKPTEAEFLAMVAKIKERVYDVTPKTRYTIMNLEQHVDTGEANIHWLAARKGRITGSTIGSILGLNKYQSPQQLLKQLLWGTFKGNAATAYGNENEDFVQESLEHLLKSYFVGQVFNGKRVKSFVIENPGLVINLHVPYMAMSPDGVLVVKYEDGTTERVLLEYKAPYSRRNYRFATEEEDAENIAKKGTPKKVADIYASQITPGLDSTKRPIPKYYTPQLCYGMHILNLNHAFFVSWVPVRSTSGVVKKSEDIFTTPSGTIQFTHLARNAAFETKMVEEVKRFWHKEYVPRLAMKELGQLTDGFIDIL